MTDLQHMLVRADGFVPKERYTTRAFTELEQARLWPRVWQIACREEQVAAVGDFVEYTIGNEGVAIVRSESGELHAFYNACLHRGRRLAEGCGSLRGRRDPMPVSRLVLRARRAPRRCSRPRRVHDVARRPRARTGPGRHVGRVRVRQPRPEGRAAARLPRSAADACSRRITSNRCGSARR